MASHRSAPSRRVIPPLAAGALCGPFFVHMAVMGSGILPVSLALLSGLGATLGVMVGAISLVLPRTWMRVTASVIAIFFVVSYGFRRLVDESLLVAQQYGSGVAGLIERQAAATGQWPGDLGAIRGLRGVPLPPPPYLSYPEPPRPKIAGFFLVYDPNPPRLGVLRRGFGAEYDWTAKRWRKVVGKT
jgi:hypothetical protein